MTIKPSVTYNNCPIFQECTKKKNCSRSITMNHYQFLTPFILGLISLEVPFTLKKNKHILDIIPKEDLGNKYKEIVTNRIILDGINTKLYVLSHLLL